MPKKTLLITQAPARKGTRADPLTGATGKRLAALVGMDLSAFAAMFERAYLVPDWSGPERQPPSLELLNAGADKLRPTLAGRRVLMIGTRVAERFFMFRPEHYDWFQWSEAEPGFEFAVVPHQLGGGGGVSNWWNDEGNVRRAQEFVRGIKVGFLAPAKRRGKDRFSVEEVKAALEAGRGVYSWAAEILAETTGVSCHAKTIRRYVEDYNEEISPALDRSRAIMAGGVVKGIMAKAEAGDMAALKELAGYRFVQDAARELLGIDLRKNIGVEHSGGVDHRHLIPDELATALEGASAEELRVLMRFHGRVINATPDKVEISPPKR